MLTRPLFLTWPRMLTRFLLLTNPDCWPYLCWWPDLDCWPDPCSRPKLDCDPVSNVDLILIIDPTCFDPILIDYPTMIVGVISIVDSTWIIANPTLVVDSNGIVGPTVIFFTWDGLLNAIKVWQNLSLEACKFKAQKPILNRLQWSHRRADCSISNFRQRVQFGAARFCLTFIFDEHKFCHKLDPFPPQFIACQVLPMSNNHQFLSGAGHNKAPAVRVVDRNDKPEAVSVVGTDSGEDDDVAFLTLEAVNCTDVDFLQLLLDGTLQTFQTRRLSGSFSFSLTRSFWNTFTRLWNVWYKKYRFWNYRFWNSHPRLLLLYYYKPFIARSKRQPVLANRRRGNSPMLES